MWSLTTSWNRLLANRIDLRIALPGWLSKVVSQVWPIWSMYFEIDFVSLVTLQNGFQRAAKLERRSYIEALQRLARVYLPDQSWSGSMKLTTEMLRIAPGVQLLSEVKKLCASWPSKKIVNIVGRRCIVFMFWVMNGLYPRVMLSSESPGSRYWNLHNFEPTLIDSSIPIWYIP